MVGQNWTVSISLICYFFQKKYIYISKVRFITDTSATVFQFFFNIYGFYEQSYVFAPPNLRFSKIISFGKKIARSVHMLPLNISRNVECPKMNRKGVPDLPHLIEV